MPFESGKTYKIVNVQAGTVLDLYRPSYTTISGWEWLNGDNQKWIVEINEDKWFFKNKERQTFIGVVPSLIEGYAKGFRLIGTFAEAFAWEVEHVGKYGDAYRLRLPGTKFNADLADGDTRNNIPVSLWDPPTEGDGLNQIWRFEEVTC